MSQPTILVAEDEPLASMALRAQLEALDYRVIGPARDGDEAVAIGACFPAELAIFDFGMPGRNGIEAAVALFEIAPTPVVLLSGFDSAYLPAPMPRPPIFASITKPVNLADIRAGLQTAKDEFRRWVEAEPARALGVQAGLDERAAIEDRLRTAHPDGTVLRAAVRLFHEAAAAGSDLRELADALPGEDGPT